MTPTVYLVEADNLLRLNLDQDMHLVLLRAHLDRKGHARLDEAPDLSAFGWINGHAHEVVIPLATTTPALAAPRAVRSARIRTVERGHGHLPGASMWLYAKLYGHPDRYTDLLIRVPDLLAGWESPPDWWYVPYSDPEPHLRLRFRLPSADAYGPATLRLGAWADDLRHAGLLGHMQLDTYHPETGRYGTGVAMAAAEAVFAADSAAAISQLTRAAGHSQDALTAASIADLAIAFTGSTRSGMRWLVRNLSRETTPRIARPLHDEAIRLTDPSSDWAVLRATHEAAPILAAWSRRRASVAAYSALLTTTDHIGSDAVLASLLHMHHIRINGPDQDAERVRLRLARAAALAWTIRNRP